MRISNRSKLLFVTAAAVACACLATGGTADARPEAGSNAGASRSANGDLQELYGVAEISPTDVWSIGYYAPESQQRTGPVARHWDGKRWRIFDFSHEAPGQLRGVVALSASDVWAVGTDTSSWNQTLVQHWDGESWTRVESPDPGVAWLSGVDAASPDDVWAVGTYVKGTHPVTDKPLALHWDGAAWTKVAVHGGRTRRSVLNAVSVGSSTEAWAVGTDGESGSLSRHWEGTSWGRH